MSERERLQVRRNSETFRLEQASMRYRVTISRFADGGISEAFTANHKRGNANDVAARDCGIFISLCLQYGCPIETIAGALSRSSNGSASGLVRAAVDRVLDGGDGQ